MINLSEMEFSATATVKGSQRLSPAQHSDQRPAGIFFSMLGQVQADIQAYSGDEMDVSDQKLMTLEEFPESAEALIKLSNQTEQLTDPQQIVAEQSGPTVESGSALMAMMAVGSDKQQTIGNSPVVISQGDKSSVTELPSVAEKAASDLTGSRAQPPAFNMPVTDSTPSIPASEDAEVVPQAAASRDAAVKGTAGPSLVTGSADVLSEPSRNESETEAPLLQTTVKALASFATKGEMPVESANTLRQTGNNGSAAAAQVIGRQTLSGVATDGAQLLQQAGAGVSTERMESAIRSMEPEATPGNIQAGVRPMTGLNPTVADETPVTIQSSEGLLNTGQKTEHSELTDQRKLNAEDTLPNADDTTADRKSDSIGLKSQAVRIETTIDKNHFTLRQPGAFMDTSYESISTLGATTSPAAIGSGQANGAVETLSSNNSLQLPVSTLSLKQPGWDRSLGSNISFMLKENISSASIKVKPAELGPMNIHLSVQSDQLTVTIAATHAQTREALEASLPRLREQFTSLGFSDVNVNIDLQGQAGKDQRNMAGNRDFPVNSGYSGAGDDDTLDDATLISTHRPGHNGILDTFA